MMRPRYSILDPSFRYVPAAATSVAETWRRFGWRPTTEEERRSRAGPAVTLVVDEVGRARPIRLAGSRAQARALTAVS